MFNRRMNRLKRLGILVTSAVLALNTGLVGVYAEDNVPDVLLEEEAAEETAAKTETTAAEETGEEVVMEVTTAGSEEKEGSALKEKDDTDEEDTLGVVESYDMYRLYNPNSGEHFYTGNYVERDMLLLAGWNYEGIAWTAPGANKTPVYRMYNPNAGDHHYTMNPAEKDMLVLVGWNYEGVGWYSSEKEEIPLYRQYNPNAVTGSHNYTTNKGENDILVSYGWNAEGIGWYGMPDPDTTIEHPVTIYKQFDYAAVYDYKYYLNHHQDVYDSCGTDDGKVLEHFVNTGTTQRRAGNSTFSVLSYYNKYQDLRLKYGKNYTEYYKDYCRSGKSQGRICSGVLTLQDPVTSIDGYDFSAFYDFYYYINKYPEVYADYANDDIGALRHFRDVDLLNHRKAKENPDNQKYEEAYRHFAVRVNYPDACNVLDQIGWDLGAAFNWAASGPYVNIGMPASMGAHYFAKWTFDNNGAGDCYGMSCAFYEMAMALGYDAHWVAGYVPQRGGGMVTHGWVEIDNYNGYGTLVFDPDFQYESGNNGFAIYYGQSGTWRYSDYARQN